MIGTENAGFTIIAAVPLASDLSGAGTSREQYVVTGIKVTRLQIEYVTWRAEPGAGHFYSGQYFTGANARQHALADMIERADFYLNGVSSHA